MIDIHCHILPGVDDGAEDFKTAEKMLAAAAEDKINTIICTPHGFPQAFTKLTEALAELRPTAEALGIRLLPGIEYPYNSIRPESPLQPLGSSSFLLIDFACQQLPPSVGDMFFSLECKGFQIIIAHPERTLASLESCKELLRLGAFFQLNADSILGRNGKGCRRMADRMIRAGYCHYVASDAHGEHRTFHLSACREKLEAEYGRELAEKVTIINPKRLLENLVPETIIPAKKPAKGIWHSLGKFWK